jgi:hypothetical protein
VVSTDRSLRSLLDHRFLAEPALVELGWWRWSSGVETRSVVVSTDM